MRKKVYQWYKDARIAGAKIGLRVVTYKASKCKTCGKTYRDGDLRERYSNEQRLKSYQVVSLKELALWSIERMEGVPNPLIIKWIRKFSKILRRRLNDAEIPEDAKKIQIIELDEFFFLLSKKTNKVYVWLAVDQVRSKVIDFEVTDSRELSSYLPIAIRLEGNYKI